MTINNQLNTICKEYELNGDYPTNIINEQWDQIVEIDKFKAYLTTSYEDSI